MRPKIISIAYGAREPRQRIVTGTLYLCISRAHAWPRSNLATFTELYLRPGSTKTRLQIETAPTSASTAALSTSLV